jgi:hypothetical protein
MKIIGCHTEKIFFTKSSIDIQNEWILSISKEKIMLLLSGQGQKFCRNPQEVSRSPGFEFVSINGWSMNLKRFTPVQQDRPSWM